MDKIMKLYVIRCFTNDGRTNQIIDNVEFDRTYKKTLSSSLLPCMMEYIKQEYHVNIYAPILHN